MNKEQVDSKKQEDAEVENAARELRKHLKTLSKNDLINAVMQLAGAIMHTTELNRGLNEALDVLKKERANNEEANSSASTTTA